MKTFLYFFLIFLSTSFVAAQDVVYSFANNEIYFDGTDSIYGIDVMIASQTQQGSFILSSGQLYFNYNVDAFGPNIASNLNVSIDISGLDYLLNLKDSEYGLLNVYSQIQLNDNTIDRFSLAWQQDRAGACISETVNTVPQKLFRIQLKFQSQGTGFDPMLCFESLPIFTSQTYTECGPFDSCASLPGVNCLMFPGNQILSDSFSCQIDNFLRINAIVILEGPYNNSTGTMNSILSSVPDFPLSEPYFDLGWHTGGEVAASRTFNMNPVIDWVLLELRDKNDNTVVIETKAGLLLEDGSVLNANGEQTLNFEQIPDDYFIGVRHRNHFGAITSNPLQLSSFGTNTVNFTTSALFGIEPVNIIDGKQVLWMGDANSNGTIDAADRSKTWNDRNTSNAYIRSDCNLDGNVDAADRSITWNRRNRTQQIP